MFLLAWNAAAIPALAAKAPDWVLRAQSTALNAQLLSTQPTPDAVVLWRQQIVTAGSSTGSTKLFFREAVKILTTKGEKAGTFHSSYDDDSSIDFEGAWTLHSDGSAEELKSRDVVSKQLAHAELFTDTYVVSFRPPRLSPGDIASYALSRKSRRDVYQWVIPLQTDHPIVAQEVVINLPEGWTHRWRLTSAPEGYDGVLSGQGNSRASYSFGPQHGIPEESLAPPLADRAARVEIGVEPPGAKYSNSVFESWADVGTWFYRKSLSARSDPGEISSLQMSATEAARWVQDNVRYVAVEVGQGRFVPREPALVARRRYGDCKDKSFLLMALLARTGIEVFPVLTRPHRRGSIDPDFPSPVQFSHLIVAVREHSPTAVPAEVTLSDGPAVLFDPTDSWTPYGQLPSALQGARGLLVRREGSQLIEFPVAGSRTNRMRRMVEAEISLDQRLSATITEETEGSVSQRGYYQQQSPIQRNDAVSRLAQAWIPASHVFSLEFTNLDEREKPLQMRFRVSSDGYLRRTGSMLLLSVLPFPVGPSRILQLSRRRSPIELGPPHSRELLATFRLPRGLRIEALPDPIDVDNACCRYHFAVSGEGDRLVSTETYEVREQSVPLTELSLWEAVESAAARAIAAKAVLVLGN